MNFNSIKKISLAVCFSITAIASGFAQNNSVIPNWNFECNDDSYVEIVGTGMQTPGAPPSILNISNIANVDSIMVEVIYKGVASGVPHAAIIQTSNGDSIYNANPVVLPSLGSNHVAGAFRTTIGAASSISAYVTPPNAASNTWAMIAYVYRSGNGIGSTSAGVYAQPLILNTNWMFNLPIPVTATSKTVEILTPIVELDNAIDRIAIISVITAGIAQMDTVSIPNAGTSLNLHTITLNNVPAAANKVTVDFISPGNGTGDSFIGSAMVTVNNTCPNPVGIKVDAKTNVTCTNGNDGIIDIHAIGGIAPYTYLWNDGVTTEDRTNLSTGTYTVTVTDNQGSTAVITRNINTKPQVKLSATKINILCKGFSNGSIDVTAISGAAPYVFIWNDGTTTEDRQNLNVGSYTVTVSDANGCSRSLIKNITQPAYLKLRLVKNDVTCNKNDDGTIEATVSGGILPYTYLWNDGVTTEDRSDLAKGSYSLIVTDANGCTISRTRFVNQPKRMNVSKTITDVKCFGESNGAIALTVTGGNGNYSYNWSNGASTKDIVGLTASKYTVTIYDGNGCSTRRNIIINQPDELIATTTSSNINCFAGSDGFASISVSGGNGLYTYTWSNGSTASNANNLSAGTYAVLVTDAKGCNVSESITINEPTQMVVSSQINNISCNGGSNGAVELNVNGGTSPYSYNWSNGANTRINSNLTVGTYNVTVTDAKGCIANFSCIISQPNSITATIFQTNVSCYGSNDGMAVVSASGGIAPYVYTWSNGLVSDTLTALSAGTYTVVITDNSGLTSTCSATYNVVITEPALLTCAVSNSINVSCNGASNGSATVNAAGGIPPYSYAWSNGFTGSATTNLSFGTYTVIITDNSGLNSSCSTICIVNITEPDPLILSTVVTDATCSGSSDGLVELNVVGGTAPHSYAWSTGESTMDIVGLAAGTYTVIVTDANNCTAIGSATVTQPDSIQLSATFTEPLCNGGQTGTIDLTVTGGVGPFQYVWSNQQGIEDPSAVSAGSYTVLVTDLHSGSSCSASLSIMVTDPAPLNILPSITHILCSGGNNGSVTVSVIGGTPPYTYLWATGETTASIINIIAGSYTVQVTDANNCQLMETAIVTEPLELNGNSQATGLLCFNGNNGQIDVSVNGGTFPYTYLWSTGATTQDLIGIQQGVYSVYITDANGCSIQVMDSVSDPAAIVLSATINNVNCFNGNDGFIDLSVVGGIAPYTYEWSNSASTQDINNLSAGAYAVTVTDANGCVSNRMETISQPVILVLSTSITNATCNGVSNGSISVTVNGGTPDYSYIWSNGESTMDIVGLAAGTYTVLVSDENNCTLASSASVSQPDSIQLSATFTEPLCYGDQTGTIDLTVTGGIGPFQYLWSNQQEIEDPAAVNAGTYTVTVTDLFSGSSCSATLEVTVTEPNLVSCNATSSGTVACGSTNGTVSVNTVGGTSPYTYIWSNGATESEVNGLSSGVYTVIVTDVNQCSSSCTTEIINLPHPTITVCPDQEVALMPGPEVNCHYAQVLNVEYNGVAGTTVKVYLETPPSNLLNTFVNVQPGQVLTTSSMNVGENKFKSRTYFTVDNGTSIETYEAHTSCSVPLLGLDFGDFHVTGFQNANGTSYDEATSGPKASVTATALASGGTAPYTYAWSNNLSGSIINFNVAQNTSISVTVTDANGCTASAAHQVNVVDIRSTNYPNKVIMCHNPLTSPHEHNVEIKDIAKKLSEGWTLGPCGYDFSQPTACGSVVELPCECKGGVQALGFIYSGPTGGSIDAYQDDKINPSKLIANFTNLQPGDSIQLFATMVNDDKIGDVGIALNGSFIGDLHTSCSVPLDNATVGNVVTVYGFVDKYGSACNMPAPPAPPAACACNGKIVEMTVIYDGPANATVSVGPNSSGTNPFVRAGVNPGDTLIINLGNIGNDWYYLVNGTQDAYMHASCSDDIMGNINASKSDFGNLGNYPNPDAGNNLGTFLVIGHVDENGNICSLQNYIPRYAVTGTDQGKLEGDFIRIFPNPSSGNINLEYTMNENTNVDIKVLDVTGRTVEYKSVLANTGMNLISLDLSHLNSGVYFINLNNTLERKILKFVIQK